MQTVVHVKFYFDYRSPFSFLAKDPAYQLEHDFHVQLEFKPYAFPLEDAFGNPEVDRRRISMNLFLRDFSCPDRLLYHRFVLSSSGERYALVIWMLDASRMS